MLKLTQERTLFRMENLKKKKIRNPVIETAKETVYDQLSRILYIIILLNTKPEGRLQKKQKASILQLKRNCWMINFLKLKYCKENTIPSICLKM